MLGTRYLGHGLRLSPVPTVIAGQVKHMNIRTTVEQPDTFSFFRWFATPFLK